MLKTISSTSNPSIKLIKKLKRKKERDSSGLFFIEGIRLAGEAVKDTNQVETLIFCSELLDSEFGLEVVETAIEENKFEILQVNEMVFNSIAGKDKPQGLAVVARQRWHSIGEVCGDHGIWIGLHEIQDPGNLGSILRTADGSGAKGILLIGNSTDPFHPTSVRASTGAVFTQKLINLSKEEFLLWKQSDQTLLIGAVCDDAEHYKKYNYPDDLILLLGSEQKGLPGDLMAACDILINIPLFGSVDSLNIANAASILLFEIINKIRKFPK